MRYAFILCLVVRFQWLDSKGDNSMTSLIMIEKVLKKNGRVFIVVVVFEGPKWYRKKLRDIARLLEHYVNVMSLELLKISLLGRLLIIRLN